MSKVCSNLVFVFQLPNDQGETIQASVSIFQFSQRSDLAFMMFLASRSTISSNPIAYMSMGLSSSLDDWLTSTKAEKFNKNVRSIPPISPSML